MGSVGDIDFAIKKAAVKDDLFVLGGDNLFDYHLKDFVAFASDKNSAVTIGLYDIHNLKDATNYGVVELGAGSRLVSFRRETSQATVNIDLDVLLLFSQGDIILPGAV